MPDGWEYIHLSTIGELYSGYTPKQNELALNGEIPYFKVSDMNTVGNEIHLCHTQNYLTNSPKKIFQKNSIVFPKNGGAVFTNKKRILIENSVVDLNTGVFTPTTCIDFDYVFLIFSTIDFREHYKGTALPTINNEFMNSLLFGLPPLAEQTRIVKAFKEIEPFIVEYDKLEQQKSKLDSEIYDKLKKSILQYAIQGKLVPQDENDEPASELLKRIRAEKKAQLGKKYVDSYIYKGDDNCYYEHIDGKAKDEAIEVPFDLPDNWSWSKLKDIAYTQTGTTPTTSNPNNLGTYIPFIKPGDILDGTINYFNEGLSQIGLANGRLIRRNSILMVCIGGSLGKCALCDRDVSCNQQINTATPEKRVESKYLFYCLISDYFYKAIKDKATGTATPIINRSLWENMFVPMPPLAEQQRIVYKINEIFAKL